MLNIPHGKKKKGFNNPLPKMQYLALPVKLCHLAIFFKKRSIQSGSIMVILDCFLLN